MTDASQYARFAPIILIGPMSAGKSTIAELLSQQLGLPRRGLDALRWDYYAEIGYSSEDARRIEREEGRGAMLRYWKPFEAHAVERILGEYADGVLDFGAGHSVYEDPILFERVQQALAPYPNVILLLPSPDLDESVTIVNARFVKMVEEEGEEEVDPEILDVNEQFTRHPSNFKLARHTVYTKYRTPQETADEITSWLEGGASPQ